MEAIDYLDYEEECPRCKGIMVYTGNGTFSMETYAIEWRCQTCHREWIETFDGKMTTISPMDGRSRYND